MKKTPKQLISQSSPYGQIFILAFQSPAYNKLMTKAQASKFTIRRPAKPKYRKYDYHKRQRLIQFVEKQNKPLAPSAKLLGIAQTTARLIMKTWRDQRRVFQKKADRTKREKKEARKKRQAKLKENEKIRKMAKKLERMTLAQNPIKVQENPQVLISGRETVLPQIPLEGPVSFDQSNPQSAVYFVYNPWYFY